MVGNSNFDIAARLIEAAETERRLPADGTRPDGIKGFWPDYRHAWLDIVQWGTRMEGAHKAGIAIEQVVDTSRPDYDPDDDSTWRRKDLTPLDERNSEIAGKMARTSATAAEVSRYEECLGWIITHVRRPEDRRAVAAWAKSKAGRLPFRKWCRANGLHQRTGQRRAERAIEQIAGAVGQSLALWGAGEDRGVSSKAPEIGSDFATLDFPRSKPGETFWRAHDAIPSGAGDPEVIARDLAEIRARRRKKLGLPPLEEEGREAA